MRTRSFSCRLQLRAASHGSDGNSSDVLDSEPVAVAHATSVRTRPELSSQENEGSIKTSTGSKCLSTNEVKYSSRGKRSAKSSRSTNTGKRSHLEVSDIEDLGAAVLCTFTEAGAARIRSCLLSWYDRNHRILPWRQNSHSLHQVCTDLVEGPVKVEFGDRAQRATSDMKDEIPSVGRKLDVGKDQANTKTNSRGVVSKDQRAYEVWVSEMMLQQTQVVKVLEYYDRWMERWPTIHHLSQASQEEVDALWAGLGYYRRARFLLEGAKQIVEKCKGAFPDSLAALQQVPGIGKYTAGAIASIAFEKPVPLVDGNVIRVLCRLKAISDNPKAPGTVNLLWALAKELVDVKRPGDLNQAIMELGATVCKVANPSCSSCPVASHCDALSLASLRDDHHKSKLMKSVTDFPVKVAKTPPRDEFVMVCILEVASNASAFLSSSPNVGDDSHILLVRRPEKGLLAGLWEFPSVPLGKSTCTPEEQRMMMDCYLKGTLDLGGRGGVVEMREIVGTYLHVFSHIRMHMSIEWLLLSIADEFKLHRLITETRAHDSPVIKWVTSTAVGSLGLTSGVKKVHSMYLNHLKSRGQSNKHQTPRR